MTGAPTPFDAFDLPPPWPESLLARIREHNTPMFSPFVVLDDDPLGGQCLHDIAVLTDWNPYRLHGEMEWDKPFLLLTDTRALDRDGAVERAEDVGRTMLQAAAAIGNLATLLWRSDSTLRGHFWWEMQAFAQEYPGEGMPEPVYVFIPYFGDAGRFTINDVQYVLEDDALTPVAETEFAHDPAYAFEHSHLPAWLEAHSEGHFAASDVVSISLEDLRLGGPSRVTEILVGVPEGAAVVVNAAADRDLEVFVAGLQAAEEKNGYYLCSGAAPFIRVRLGQEPRPLLTATELDAKDASTGGLIVVGSYVERTSQQLSCAMSADGALEAVELHIDALLDATTHDVEVQIAALAVAGHISAGRDVILHPSRQYVPGAPDTTSKALSAVVRSLGVRPRFLLAKGGSTASRLATDALGVKRATVLGQLLPGVPVWRLGPESRWPGLPFVIFAGNVGRPESLSEALRILSGS